MKFLKAEHPLPSDWRRVEQTGSDFEATENIDDSLARSIVFHFELMADQTGRKVVALHDISFGYGWPGIDLPTAADRYLFNPIRRSLGGKLISDAAFGQILIGVSSSTKHCMFDSDGGRLYRLDSVDQNSEAQFSKFIERLKSDGPVIDVRLQGLIDSDYFHIESITSPSAKF